MNNLTKEQVIKFLKMGFAVSADHYHEDVFVYLDGGIDITNEVTHWMPLPEPPKDTQESCND